MKLFYFIFLFITVCFNTYSQDFDAALIKSKDSRVQTLRDLASFLRSAKTLPIALHQNMRYSKEESFYDTVIQKFFSVEKMKSSFAVDTGYFSVEGGIDLQRHMLHSIDAILDIIPMDSFYVQKLDSESNSAVGVNYDERDAELIKNSLKVYTIVDGTKIDLMLFDFDQENGKLISVSFYTKTLKEHELLRKLSKLK